MLYADQLYTGNRLKNRLRSEISQLRHYLAKLEYSSVSSNDESVDSEEDARVVSIYRNMIQQRQKLYRSIV